MIRRIPLLAGLLLTGLIAGCSTAPHQVPFTRGTADRNLTYCDSQRLDLFIPRVALSRPLPIAMYVHGGGMTGGDKTDINPVFLNPLTSAGYAVASVNYRLAPEFRFPAQIEDVKCAIRYLRADAPRYGLDGREIFGFGTSVGGQLVALAALTGPHSTFDVGRYPTESSNLLAVVDIFGPANLTETASGFSIPPASSKSLARNDQLGSWFLRAPRTSLFRTRRPSFLFRGSTTQRFSNRNRLSSLQRPQGRGDRTQLVLVHNMGHMFMQVGPKPLDPSLRSIAQDAVSFFDGERKL